MTKSAPGARPADGNWRIAGYCRISVDEEMDRENTSIENQKAIIGEYVGSRFPNALLTFYEDRDRSGYTFEQREGYQALRRGLFSRDYDILIIKDFSRFSRRNSKGLAELEDLRDIGIRIIAVTDNVDYPTNDDWLSIQFRFLMNELPVTETSKKVRKVIELRQKKGEWLCAAPYGYYLNPLKKGEVLVDGGGAAVVRLIFDLYNKGWGYKRIARRLTEEHCPTALQLTAKRLREKGADAQRVEEKASPVWSPVSVAKIVSNDFYIGTLRQHVWSRTGINKKDRRVNRGEQLVFENHHEAIIPRETFDKARENFARRTNSRYKGVRKYPNTYSGFLFCEDCRGPMFAVSSPNRPAGYVCGTYHRRGLAGCTSHHIRESAIDESVRSYIASVRDSLSDALLDLDVEKSRRQAEEASNAARQLSARLAAVKLELKESNRQRVRQLAVRPENETILEETFNKLDEDYLAEIRRLTGQLDRLSGEAGRKTALRQSIGAVLDTFNRLLGKDHFTKQDIGLIIDRITVSRDKTLTVELKSDIGELFSVLRA